MNRNGKIAICFLIAIICVGAILCASTLNRRKVEDGSKLSIVTTTFSCYDFAKQIVGDKANVTFM